MEGRRIPPPPPPRPYSATPNIPPRPPVQPQQSQTSLPQDSVQQASNQFYPPQSSQTQLNQTQSIQKQPGQTQQAQVQPKTKKLSTKAELSLLIMGAIISLASAIIFTVLMFI